MYIYIYIYTLYYYDNDDDYYYILLIYIYIYRHKGYEPSSLNLVLELQGSSQQNCLVVSTNPSEKYYIVSWDYEIPNIWKNNPNVPNHQPEKI